VTQNEYAANKRKGLPAPNPKTPSMQDAIIIYKLPFDASSPYPKKRLLVECTAFRIFS
jgi:hypothetical protein